MTGRGFHEMMRRYGQAGLFGPDNEHAARSEMNLPRFWLRLLRSCVLGWRPRRRNVSPGFNFMAGMVRVTGSMALPSMPAGSLRMAWVTC